MRRLPIKKIISVLLIAPCIYLNAFSFDKKYKQSSSLLLSSHYEVPYILGYSLFAYSLMQGIDNKSESKFKRASSKAIEALVISQISTEIIKLITGRKRPRNTDSSEDWGYYGNKSFPSGHVSSTTSMILPYILEYGQDYPEIYLLALLPAHQMIGRINAQAHWSSDVIAGFLLGGAIVMSRSNSEHNLLLHFSKDEKFVGIRYIF